VLTAILHNLGLYGTTPLGIGYDHYMHFLGGFTIAIVFDRIFRENLPRAKRFILMIVCALGVGAVVEMVQWTDVFLLPDFNMFLAFDPANSMADMIGNGLGGIAMGIITVLRRRKA